MNPHKATLSALGRLYGPDAESMRRGLPEHGDSISGQLAELAARPSVERCETAIRNMAGLVQLLQRFRERLLIEGDSPNA